MKKICFIVLLGYSTLSFSQFSVFNKIISNAERAETDKNLKLSLSLYDSAFKVIDFIPYYYMYAFKISIHNNNYKKATTFLVKGTLKGLNITDWSFPEIPQYLNTEEGKYFNSIRDSLIKNYFNSIDTISINILMKLKNQDQSLRDNSLNAIKNDSLILSKLIELSIERGFPTFKKTGYGQSAASLLLWHHRDEYPNSKQWQQIIPFIKKEMKEGNIDSLYFEPFKKFKEEVIK
ncbi:MAG: hypothetical protein ABI448_14555 [Bacteroidia bacterium]